MAVDLSALANQIKSLSKEQILKGMQDQNIPSWMGISRLQEMQEMMGANMKAPPAQTVLQSLVSGRDQPSPQQTPPQPMPPQEAPQARMQASPAPIGMSGGGLAPYRPSAILADQHLSQYDPPWYEAQPTDPNYLYYPKKIIKGIGSALLTPGGHVGPEGLGPIEEPMGPLGQWLAQPHNAPSSPDSGPTSIDTPPNPYPTQFQARPGYPAPNTFTQPPQLPPLPQEAAQAGPLQGPPAPQDNSFANSIKDMLPSSPNLNALFAQQRGLASDTLDQSKWLSLLAAGGAMAGQPGNFGAGLGAATNAGVGNYARAMSDYNQALQGVYKDQISSKEQAAALQSSNANTMINAQNAQSGMNNSAADRQYRGGMLDIERQKMAIEQERVKGLVQSWQARASRTGQGMSPKDMVDQARQIAAEMAKDPVTGQVDGSMYQQKFIEVMTMLKNAVGNAGSAGPEDQGGGPVITPDMYMPQ